MRIPASYLLSALFFFGLIGMVYGDDFSLNQSEELLDQQSNNNKIHDRNSGFGLELNTSKYALSSTDTLQGIVLDSVQQKPIAEVKVFCFDKNAVLVASTVSNLDGAFCLVVPKGTYSVLATKISFYPVRKIVSVFEFNHRTIHVNLQPVSTYAGYAQYFDGDLAEGKLNDVTLMNSKVALKIGGVLKSQGLTSSERGNPIDFCAVDRTDGFDWIDIPCISKVKISGLQGFKVAEHVNVIYNSVKIVQSTPDSSVVMTQGNCNGLPIQVTNMFSIYPDKEWLKVSSCFTNLSDDTVSCWIGDMMDNDEEGQTSVIPISPTSAQVINNKDIALQEFHPALPWMGCFGISDQVFSMIYEGEFANDFEVSANTFRIVSQKRMLLPPHGKYFVTRKIGAVSISPSESRIQAINNLYALTSNPDRIETTITLQKSTFNIGEKFNATVRLTNLSPKNTFKQVLVIIKPPINITSTVDTIVVSKILPNQTVFVNFSLFTNEGSGNALINVDTKLKSKFMSSANVRLFVSGRGWYSGDNHTHSTFSDGHYTIEQNVSAAKLKGLSFINCTDHNTVAQKASVINCRSDDFLPIVGSEVTTYAGHALALFCDEQIPWDSLQESSLADAQQIVDRINSTVNGTGISVIAHPFYTGASWKWLDVVNMCGYEVFNGFNPYRSIQTRQAFNLWDNKLNAGVRVYGFADSDAHIKEMIGRLRICVYLKEFNEKAIHDAVKSGRFYGSNGPDLTFSIDSVQMGDSLSIFIKKKVKISMTAYSCEGLDSVRLIKNGKLFKIYKFSSDKRRVDIELLDEVDLGDYYRMEVNDKLDQIAFSNPIFVTFGSKTANSDDIPIIIKDTSEVVNSKGNFLYPNPASANVTLNFDVNTSGILKIFDEQGKIRYKEAIENKKEHEINIHFLPKGLYQIQINKIRLKLMVY